MKHPLRDSRAIDLDEAEFSEWTRVRLALHEVGHAIAAVFVGARVDGVTIGVDDGETGVCFTTFTTAGPAPNLNTADSVLFEDPSLRQRLEAKLVLALAGNVTVAAWAPPEPGGGYRPPTADEQERERLLAELEETGFNERLQEFEAAGPLHRTSDEDRVFRLARLGASGERCAGAFLNWITTEVFTWVRGPTFAAPLRVLTEELLRDGVLPGTRVHQVVEQTQRDIRREREDDTK